jgi:predicted TIM-barrel fold metal-dependent hydrolase
MAEDRWIIDADGHYLENPAEWAEYLPAKQVDWAPRLIVDDQGVERFLIGDEYALPARNGNAMGQMSVGDGLTPRLRGDGKPQIEQRRMDESALGGRDGQERLRLMVDEGIAVSVLYPTLCLAGLPALTRAEVASGLARAVNDWVAERFASADPTRLFPVATIPLHDPGFAAAELERCVKRLGMKAAWVSPVPIAGRLIDDAENDVVWAMAADLGIPMTTHHGSGGGGVPALGRDRNRTWLGSHAMGHPFEAMAAIAGLYTSRVFERFPTLRWGFMEAGTGWLPYWLEQIRGHAKRMKWLSSSLDDIADLGEIFAQRCIVTAEGEDPFVPQVMDAVGARSIVWASDYPHFDCEFPGLCHDVLERQDLGDSQRRDFAANNAAEFFQIQVPAVDLAQPSPVSR